MERIVNIDGQGVPLKATAALLLKYRMEFGSDPMKDIAMMANVKDDLSQLNMKVFYQMLYVMAKTADPKIPPIMEWLDQYESLDFQEVFTVVMEMLSASMGSIKKK